MKTIIAGSRSFNCYLTLLEAIRQFPFEITEVISGTARGADMLGEQWAAEHNLPVSRIPADWAKYGKRAGYVRNEQMAKVAEGALILWDGFSPGTKHMINICEQTNLPYYVYTV